MKQDGTNRIPWILAGIGGLFVLLVAVGVVAGVLGVFRLMDDTQAHVCGMAIASRSPAAIALVGTPMTQNGFTSGRSNLDNGTLVQDVSFRVRGPLAEASVRAVGTRSDFESHLEVTIGRNGTSQTLYSGPFDCPELHAK